MLNLFTDASATIGFGAYFDGQWFAGTLPVWIPNDVVSIEYLELVPILLAMLVWKERLFSKRVIFHCNNLGATQA